jgi:hypothetical protein
MVLATAAVLPIPLIAVAVAIYDIARTAPAGYSCGESPGPGHDAAVAAFRDGSVTWHALAIVACLLVLTALSCARQGGIWPPGLPTFAAVSLVAIGLPLALASEAVGFFAGAFATLIGAPGLLIAHPGAGAGAAGLIAAMAVAIPFLWLAVRGGRLRWVAAVLWWLIAFTGGHLFLAQVAGHGPIAC